jgi:transposase InsO family protein
VHGDLCGPVTPATPGGRRYFLLLIDDLSRYMWVMILGSKGEAVNAIRRVQVAAEAECDRKLRVLRTDNDGEFTAAEFASYCADEGVQRHYSVPYSPQQNGVVERRNQTVVGMARALLKQSGIPAIFWGEAVVTAVYILNRSPTKALNGMTPYEACMGASRRSLTYGSSAASRSPRSLATSASSTTGAPRGCSLATRRARRPTASLTQEHSVCARRAT